MSQARNDDFSSLESEIRASGRIDWSFLDPPSRSSVGIGPGEDSVLYSSPLADYYSVKIELPENTVIEASNADVSASSFTADAPVCNVKVALPIMTIDEVHAFLNSYVELYGVKPEDVASWRIFREKALLPGNNSQANRIISGHPPGYLNSFDIVVLGNSIDETSIRFELMLC